MMARRFERVKKMAEQNVMPMMQSACEDGLSKLAICLVEQSEGRSSRLHDRRMKTDEARMRGLRDRQDSSLEDAASTHLA